MSTLRLYCVHIPANVYTGRYFDYQTAPVDVVARNPQHARNIVNRHQLSVLLHLWNRKIRSGDRFRYLIPHREAPNKNVFFRGNYYVQLVRGYNCTALCPDGSFKMVYMKPGTPIVERYRELG